MLALRIIPAAAFVVLGVGACGTDSSGEWKLSDAKVAITADNHVAVDVIYMNGGDKDWGGSRCLIIDWEKGGVQSREDVRAQKPPASPIEIVETERYCNGGNKSLSPGSTDTFHVVSSHLRDQLAGSTVVVVAEDFKGGPNDDRVTLPSP